MLKAGKTQDLEKIREVDVTPMVKGKLLFLYFPDRFVNIFSERHVDYFLARLRLNDPSRNVDLVAKKDVLCELKRDDEVFATWSIMEFTEFLYSVWHPPSRTAPSEAPTALKKFLLDLPPLEETHAEFIKIEMGAAPTPKRPRDSSGRPPCVTNFQAKSRRDKILGDHGEDIVFLTEKYALKKAGQIGLFDKVHHGSRFHIYVVFEADSRTPKILRLSNPARMENESFLLEPTSYRASLLVSDE